MRLTTRIKDKVYFSKGKYPPTTIISEMTTLDIRECMKKLAMYEDKEEKELSREQSNKEGYNGFSNIQG